MPESTQQSLPMMPVRFIVSAVWDGPERWCTIRATSDAPSDQYAEMWIGQDTEGLFTIEELADCMSLMLMDTIDRWARSEAQKLP